MSDQRAPMPTSADGEYSMTVVGRWRGANRENPVAVDERLLGLKSALEEAVKDHLAL